MNTILDESKLDAYKMLRELGVNIDSLRAGDLEKMLNGGRSSLITIFPTIGGVCFPMQCKLSIMEKLDGSLVVIPHPIRKGPKLDEYRGYKFTDADRESLLKTGNLGHTITIYSYFTEPKEVYISLDRETNEIVQLPKELMHFPSTIKGFPLTDEQIHILETGAPLDLLCKKIQVNAVHRCLMYV